MSGGSRRLRLSWMFVVTLAAVACTGDTGPGTSPSSTIPTTQAAADPVPTLPADNGSTATPPEAASRACEGPFAPEIPSSPTTLANEKVRVDFVGGQEPTGYAVSVYDGEGWFRLATAPLFDLVYGHGSDAVVVGDVVSTEVEVDGASAVVMSTVEDAEGADWQVRVDFTLEATQCVIQVVSSVTVDQDRDLVLFASPSLDVGEPSFGVAKDTAVLGGLDWSIDGEDSQASAVVPHPLDVALPMMALSYDGHLLALTWDPLQAWDGVNLMPQPVFVSPNWIEDAESHKFALAVPTAPRWMSESRLVDERNGVAKAAAAIPIPDRVANPYPMEAGAELRISSSLLVDSPAGIPQAVQLYLNRFALPPPPDFSLDAGIETVVDAYLRTAWDPESAQWYQGTFGPRARWISVALQLLAYADGSDDSRAAQAMEGVERAMGPRWQDRHDAGPSAAHMDFVDFGFRTGDTEEVLIWSQDAAAGARGAQRPDGSWGYRELDNICDSPLGESGEATLGTTAVNASMVLEHARITRQPEAIDAGLMALDHMDQFLKPAGAQIGEVPLVHADPWAVAWAIRAYVEGYRISGDRHHLAKARDWAFMGIPFMYTWSHPDRPVMAYSTIGVMGTSCWTGSWAGMAVQWVGLDYAASLLDLADVDDSYPWAEIADGIARAAVGMLDTRAETPPGQWQEVVLTTTAPADAFALGFSVRVNHELSIPGPTEFLLDEVELIDLTTGENVILNGDFEIGALDAEPWFWEGAGVELVSGEECRSGRCVHALVGGEDILAGGADISAPAKPHGKYQMRLWVKLMDDPLPSSGPLFRVEYFLASGDTKWVSVFARPLTGLLADGYDIEDQAGYAPILPDRLGDVLLGLAGAPLHVRTVTPAGGADFAVSGLSGITDVLVGADGELSFVVSPHRAPVSHLVISMPRVPTQVLVDNGPVSDWRWVAERGLLFMSVEHPSLEARSVVVR